MTHLVLFIMFGFVLRMYYWRMAKIWIYMKRIYIMFGNIFGVIGGVIMGAISYFVATMNWYNNPSVAMIIFGLSASILLL